MLALTLFLTLLPSARLAVAAENEIHNTFASIVFVRSGERTPTSISYPRPKSITSLGARQMHDLGSNFRKRYITSTGEESRQNIIGISTNVLRNEQLSIQTLNKPYLVSSAQAFMQGLYPPSKPNGTQNGADYTLADGSKVDFPLNGYQYADIRALGETDPRSIHLDGMRSCPAAKKASLMYEAGEEFLKTKVVERAFYKNLDPGWFREGVDRDEINYINAMDIYDHLSYAYTHNSTTYHALQNSTKNIYNRTRFLANQMAYYTYANTSTSPPSLSTDKQAISGKTLTALILTEFQAVIQKHHNASSTASPHSLTLLFGDFAPMTSFFSLAMKAHTPDAFKSAPPYASAMTFELFSIGNNSTFPHTVDELFVSSYFHNGTNSRGGSIKNAQGQMQTYPLFNQSSTTIPWSMFQKNMASISIGSAREWCKACDSPSFFCRSFDADADALILQPNNSSNSNSNLNPAVSGLIGALVTLILAALGFAAAVLLGGVRFYRREGRGARETRLGGFKGATRLGSDVDVSGTGTGVGVVAAGSQDGVKVGHQRVGSYELRQKEMNKGGVAETERDVAEVGARRQNGTERHSFESRAESLDEIEAAMGMRMPAVKVHEGV